MSISQGKGTEEWFLQWCEFGLFPIQASGGLQTIVTDPQVCDWNNNGNAEVLSPLPCK